LIDNSVQVNKKVNDKMVKTDFFFNRNIDIIEGSLEEDFDKYMINKSLQTDFDFI
jgi:hypothetical protein